jgi:hypothetical protein
MAQCLGRLVRDTPKGVWMLSFEEGGLFHLPIRCDRIALNGGGGLCATCMEREQKTVEKLRDIRGTTIGGTLPSYLMGRVTEPIPYWSRLYDGAWFRLKMEEGATLSRETMAKIKVAVDAAYAGVETVPPAEMPGGVKKMRKLKVKGKLKPCASPVAEDDEVEVAEAPAVVVEAPPVVEVPAAPIPAKKKRQPKKVASPTITTITGFVPRPDAAEEPEETITIPVRKRTIDGRELYLDPKKDKLYDLKFKYVGRLKDGAIVAHPDSDAE